MSPQVPSYLHRNRYGIYYFRSRIPTNIRKKYSLKQAEIRRSMKTTNRSLALSRARSFWVYLEQNEWQQTEIKPPILDQIDLETLNSQLLLLLKKFIKNESTVLPENRKTSLQTLSTESSRTNYSTPIGKDLPDIALTNQILDNKPTPIDIPLLSTLLSIAYDFFEDSNQEWKPKTKSKYRANILQFIEIVGNKAIGSLNIQDMTIYRETMSRIPKRLDQEKYKNMTYPDLVNESTTYKETLSRKTLKN